MDAFLTSLLREGRIDFTVRLEPADGVSGIYYNALTVNPEYEATHISLNKRTMFKYNNDKFQLDIKAYTLIKK